METTLTINGTPVHHAPLTTPEAYAREWARRKPGTRVEWGYFSVYVSAYVEADQGAEIEVSALVDLMPGRADIDDVRCRVVDGAEVEIAEAIVESKRDDLVWAAMQAAMEAA